MEITTAETMLRLGASLLCGAAIGYERERASRPAGLRTQLLVSLASATFMIISTQFVYYQPFGPDDLIRIDASRIAASVVSGVGFLGAGAILRTGIGIQGLTTAASLWMTASLGMAAGSGMYLLTAVSTVAALMCLVFLRQLEGKRRWLMQRRVVVTLDDNADHTQAVGNCLREHGAAIADIEFDRNLKTHETRLAVDVRFADRVAIEKLLIDLTNSPGVWRVKVQRPG